MRKIKFISRHDMPTNLVALLSQLVDGVEVHQVEHIKESIESIPVENDSIVIAIAPDALVFPAIVQASTMAREEEGFSFELISFSMKRVRPVEGQATLPPTEIEALNYLGFFSGMNPIFSQIKEAS